jgi:hypothetical protein
MKQAARVHRAADAGKTSPMAHVLRPYTSRGYVAGLSGSCKAAFSLRLEAQTGERP